MSSSDRKSPTSSQTVLVAEDDPFMRELISIMLHTHGFRVIESVSGDHALPLLRVGGIDVLATDICMPGSLDGWSLAVRARSLHPRIVVVYSSTRPAIAARQISHSLYLQKPYHPDALIAAIRHLTS